MKRPASHPDPRRRALLGLVALAPVVAMARSDSATDPAADRQELLVLSDFQDEEPFVVADAAWRGFSDRVMGGVSDGELQRATLDGRRCIRLTGTVTRDRGGGFLQMALALDGRGAGLDASGYRGLELLVHGNDEDYNVHLRTPDVSWYDQSYRATFHAAPEWQTVRLPWSAFEPHGLSAPLDTARILRIGLLGWMREFDVDLALARLALYR